MKLKVNVGCSNKDDQVETELQKINYALSRSVDYISEISLIPEKKAQILDYIRLTAPLHPKTKFCTVPLYDSVLSRMNLLSVMKIHYSHGIRCFTLHLTPKQLIDAATNQDYVINSRAGNFLFGLAKRQLENPHFADFQQIMQFIRENHCELFVGTSLRPGRVLESTKSSLWLEELSFVVDFMEKNGVDKSEYILECGGHIDASMLDTFTQLVSANQVCMMGPLMTDATNGFDDLSSMIGAGHYHSIKPIHTHLLLTRDEHIRLPTLEALKDGVDKVTVFRHNINLASRDQSAVGLESRFQNQSNQCTTGINLFGPIADNPRICTMCGFHCPLRNIKYPSMKLQNVIMPPRVEALPC